MGMETGKVMPGLLRAPCTQHGVQPVPGHTQGLSPRHRRALCPRLAAAHNSGTEQLLPKSLLQQCQQKVKYGAAVCTEMFRSCSQGRLPAPPLW